MIYGRHEEPAIRFAGVAQAQQDLRRLSRQLSTGKRLTRPSDDPTAVGWIISARSDLANVLNQQKVLARAKVLIGPADAALDNIASALRSARDTLLGATQPGKDDAAHRADAAAIRSVRERLVDEAIPLGEITVSSPPDARQVDSTPQSR